MNGETIYRDVGLLHPKLSASAISLRQDLIRAYESGRTEFRFEIFETFRSPERQRYLVGRKTSKAGPWQSAHQFGLAVDFVPFLTQAEGEALGVKAGWYWPPITDICWKFLQQRAQQFGLDRPYSWDGPHVEPPLFRQLMNTIEKGAKAPFVSGSHAQA